ncbi:MAG: DUF6398 domain-containing protein [Jatrophihabitantaceae bacterium]
MSRRKKHSRRPGTKGRSGPRSHERREPDLMREVAAAMTAAEPLTLLALASGLIAALETDRPRPFAADPPPPVPTHGEFVQTLIEVPTAETSGLLAAFAGLSGDAVLRARVRRELAARPYVLPGWLEALPETAPSRVVEFTDVLRDGESILLGARLADGSELTAVLYLDHNAGGVVKDAFVVADDLDAVLGALVKVGADKAADLAVRDLDPADARVRLTDAIRFGAITYPPFETDTWPACRPIVEWLCAGLPDGGAQNERHEWTDPELAAVMERFLASPPGAGFDGADHRGLLDSLLWYGTGYGNGDPLLWSRTRIEILLLDWFPRKIVADSTYLAKLPDLLRAFVRFGHGERGIRAGLTDEALDAVDEYEAEYQQAIRAPRPQGPMALLAAMGALDPDGPWDDGPSWQESALERLARAVGGEQALADLDAAPLPDEAFSWDGIPDDVHDMVGRILASCDETVLPVLGVEYRTACRRLLHRVATGDVTGLRRQGACRHHRGGPVLARGKGEPPLRCGSRSTAGEGSARPLRRDRLRLATRGSAAARGRSARGLPVRDRPGRTGTPGGRAPAPDPGTA